VSEGVNGRCLLNFTLPLVDVIKGLVVGNVIHNDGSMGLSEVGLQLKFDIICHGMYHILIYVTPSV